ncbi:LRR receptor serine/threonine-protein kinase [Salix suchowensis]|nr:LRR receptor serine/threonine-protein kinase [Salix suchowensis]
MAVPFFLSVPLLLLLCQHGSGSPCSPENPYTVERLPCDEVDALVQIIVTLGLPKPSVSHKYCSPSDDKSISFECGACNESTTNICHITSLVTHRLPLHGQIDESLSELTHLNKIDLSNNQLHGTIPESLGKLTGLKTLDLEANFLNDSIPPSLGKLMNLTTLYNMLSGRIPKELGNLLNLNILTLSENRLSGYLPQELGNLSKLEQLSLHSNNLTGTLPQSFVNLKSLHRFTVSGNKLSGKIPPFIANFTNLTHLTVSDLKNTRFRFPEIGNLTSINYLVLRNCSLTGGIPDYIGNNWKSLYYLDLSFNDLSGSIPQSLKNAPSLERLSLTNNKLNGSIPPWILKTDKADLSYNNFADFIKDNITDPAYHDSTEVKTLDPGKPNMDSILALSKKCTSKHHSLFINCGGARTNAEGNPYDEDISTESFFSVPGTWAYSCSGDFIFPTRNSSEFVKNMTSGVSVLYKTARFCPVSLKYYGFCLRKGSYTVELHFAETIYNRDEYYSSLGTRIFDVYIQGERKLKDLNIIEMAKGANVEWKANFTAIVDDNNPLEIHFFWAGKGSLRILNGPLVSAISVTPKFDVDDGKLSASQIAGITIGCAFAPLLLFLFVWQMGLNWNTELREIKIEVHPDRSFNLQQIIDGTKNFSSKMENGSGRFGEVYEAKLPDQSKLAVRKISPPSEKREKDELKSDIDRKISPPSKQREKDKLKSDIDRKISPPSEKREKDELKSDNFLDILKSLSHENLVRLVDGYSNKDLHLLIYEYMETGSLHKALFEQKHTNTETELDWPTRFDICLGIAKGLNYLHEEKSSKIKIVHGNINAKNIFLDKTLTPKLSDFGLATIYNEEDPFRAIKARGSRCMGFCLGEKDLREFEAERISRRRVYLAPEHALGKAITVKADVYSYGIVVLEIVSGRSNAEYNPNQEADFLLDTAGLLRQQGKLLDLVDKKLGSRFDKKQALTLLHLAMECISQSPTLRPSMSEVVAKLSDIKASASEVVSDIKAEVVSDIKAEVVSDIKAEVVSDIKPSASEVVTYLSDSKPSASEVVTNPSDSKVSALTSCFMECIQ